MTAPFADNPLRMSICLFFRALYTLRSSQIISNKQPCIHALKKAFMGMANHLYSLDILCTDTTRTMTIWPPPGCKQLQAIYDDSRQILWYPNIIHKTVPIRHTSYAPGHRTLAVVALQARLHQHRVHTPGEQHTTAFRLSECHSTVKHACLDLPSSGSPRWCSSRLSRQATKDESAEARGGRCAQRDKGCAYLQMAHDQSEGSSPRPDELAAASTA
jgi:hypothetical protein